MTLYQAEYRSRVRRKKSKEAITMAMETRWEEAASINRSIIELFSDDIEAHNRLGKALFEQGKYAEARTAFAKALQLSPSNGIARKNLERLSLLKKEGQHPIKAIKLGPEHFLEERGKAGTVVLENPAGKEALARITAGDALTLRISDHKLLAESVDGECLGQITARLANRLVRLIQGGNQYHAAVARISGNEVTVIVRETFQHPSQEKMTSFPARSEQLHPYPQTPMLSLDLLEKEEEDEEIEAAFNSEWEENGEPADIRFLPSVTEESDADDES